MGLTIYYEWKVKADVRAARNEIERYYEIAQTLPFDDVSSIYEQDPPDCESNFEQYENSFRCGSLYLPGMRADGEQELVHVPAKHAVFFNVYVRGAETASIGLASHPPVVVHREDVIERNADGSVHGRRVGEGDPIEFPTRRRGYYSWHSSCKTQYAGNPKLGGEGNFLRAHLSLIEFLDQIHLAGARVQIRDDSKYAKHRDVDRLLQSLRDWNAIVARIAGKITDALGDDASEVVAPIRDRPDFEHLEAKGIKVLKDLATRQRRRKKGR